jgi:hypothetical protein
MKANDPSRRSTPDDDRHIVDSVSAWYNDAKPEPRSRNLAIERILDSAGPAPRVSANGGMRWLRWPALAAAAAFVVWLGYSSTQRDGGNRASGAVAFEFRMMEPDAQQVALAGDFNGWNAASTPMHRDRQSGLWRVSVTLPPGRHLYSYVVNGRRWVIDSLAPSVDLGELGPANVLALAEPIR